MRTYTCLNSNFQLSYHGLNTGFSESRELGEAVGSTLRCLNMGVYIPMVARLVEARFRLSSIMDSKHGFVDDLIKF